MLSPLLLAALVSVAQPPPPAAPPPPSPSTTPAQRGRDPWVFRCIFEDRSRMVLIAPSKDLWIAFNPGTCAIQKVWHGGVLMRGKVWDFSQDNCAAAPSPRMAVETHSRIALLRDAAESLAPPPPSPSPPSPPPAPAPPHMRMVDWTGHGVRFDPRTGFVFEGANASITSSDFDLSRWQRVFVAFDETSRKAPFHIELSADDGKTWNAQTFRSTMHGSSDSDWQWNFKELSVHAEHTRLRIRQNDTADLKTLRNLRIFGDWPAWSAVIGDKTAPANVNWHGYRLQNQTDAVILDFTVTLPDGTTVTIQHSPDMHIDPASGKVVLTSRYEISGLPEGASLIQELVSYGETTTVTGDAEANWGKADDWVRFVRNGRSTVITTFPSENKP